LPIRSFYKLCFLHAGPFKYSEYRFKRRVKPPADDRQWMLWWLVLCLCLTSARSYNVTALNNCLRLLHVRNICSCVVCSIFSRSPGPRRGPAAELLTVRLSLAWHSEWRVRGSQCRDSARPCIDASAKYVARDIASCLPHRGCIPHFNWTCPVSRALIAASASNTPLRCTRCSACRGSSAYSCSSCWSNSRRHAGAIYYWIQGTGLVHRFGSRQDALCSYALAPGSSRCGNR
jgi:hypothetical protein